MRFLFASYFVLSCFFSFAQLDISYYIPDYTESSFDPKIPLPSQVLGFAVGEKHARHDQVLRYVEAVAKLSPRVRIDTIGFTHEKRPLVHLTISASKNLAITEQGDRLEALRQEHLQLCHPAQEPERSLEAMPVVVWMGFSIHGNEPSGGNASMLTLYYLAAKVGEEHERMLENMIILLEPTYNPDGFDRFAHWANTYKGINVINADPHSREHNEVWPRGRTNHYWFDLNRDWLLVRHPESQARIRQFHRWKPNLLTDHHEMGTNSSFFFQPGVPSRNHPLTPSATFKLTKALAQFHAHALDEIGSLYYSQEGFDDFYYGKGSTYPDINGGVGILFEQASSRGQAQMRRDGRKLEFPFTIRNQFVTSLSSFEGAFNLRKQFLNLQQEFYTTVQVEAKKDEAKAFIFGDEFAPIRTIELARLIAQHDIQLHRLQNQAGFTKDGQHYGFEQGYVVRLDQAQYRLIKAMFEKRTRFQDSLFYDVSAWTLPLAFNLPYAELNQAELARLELQELPADIPFPNSLVAPQDIIEEAYAWTFDWENYHAPALLNQILAKGLIAKAATQFFSDGQIQGRPGSIVIQSHNQNIPRDSIARLLQKWATQYQIKVNSLLSGNTNNVNLGSNSFLAIPPTRILLMAGEGTSSYEVGEVWHLFDQRYHIDASLVDANRVPRLDLNDYTTIIMPAGNYGRIPGLGEKLRQWVSNGGTIVAWKSAVSFLNSAAVASLPPPARQNGNAEKKVQLPFAGRSNLRGAQAIGGTIVQGKMDLTHPLCYGYAREEIPLFKNSSSFLAPSSDPYRNPIFYTGSPLLSGYLSTANQQKLANTAAAVIARQGRGRVVALADNPNFRAFWYGTNRLMLNGIFFGFMMN
jgi:hypothetical protein